MAKHPDAYVLPQIPDSAPHLGGHNFKTHLDENVLIFAKDVLKCKSMIDIGCGPGGMVDLACRLGFDAYGIDGDWRLTRNYPERIIIHDYSKGPIVHNRRYDLAYSCEFVEHVYEKYIPNYIVSFQTCKHVIMTHAPEGKPGHHHVNCRNWDYWVNIMLEHGFKYDKEVTYQIRNLSNMKKNFIRENGLYFLNERY